MNKCTTFSPLWSTGACTNVIGELKAEGLRPTESTERLGDT